MSIYNDHLKSCRWLINSKVADKWCKTGCRNTKWQQEKELSAHVWKSFEACTLEEEAIMQTKTTGWYTVNMWVVNKYLEVYRSKI